MKKSTIVIVIFLTMFSQLEAQQWEWAKSFSGSDGPNSNDKWNEIRNTAFDSEGNIYIFGRFGPNAQLDGEQILPYYDLTMGTFLAKLSPDGTLLWHKAFKNKQQESHPFWMELVGDSVISISGDINIPSDYGYVYFLDTVMWYHQIQSIPDSLQRLPFIRGNYNYFLTYDLNGNLLDDHYLQVQDRDSIPDYGRNDPFDLSRLGTIAPFHVDKEGNTYFYTRYCYSGNENDPITVIVDREKFYDFYLPGSTSSSNEGIENVMIYKFSPDWDLTWVKPIFNGDSGLLIAGDPGFSDSTGYYFYTRIGGLSFDSEDNMYLSGTIEGYLLSETNPNSYPAFLHLDSLHSIEFRDGGSLGAQSFIIKYDTAGTVQWENQLYQHCPAEEQALNWLTNHFFAGNALNESGHAVCVLGNAYNRAASSIFFDNGTPLSQYSEENDTRLFFARFDMESGNYLSHGIFPVSSRASINVSTLCCNLAYVNNQVFATVKYWGTAYDTDTTYYDPGAKRIIMLTRWHESGTFIDMIPIFTPNATQYCQPGLTILNESGDLFATGQFDGNIIFDDLTIHGSGGHSNAFFAKYHDPSFSIPYVGISEYESRSPVLLYPNPAQSIVHIILPDNEKIEQWSLYQISGIKVMEGNSRSLNVSNMAKGCYIIKIVTDKKVSTEKLIIQ